jgi:hypothetical protein
MACAGFGPRRWLPALEMAVGGLVEQVASGERGRHARRNVPSSDGVEHLAADVTGRHRGLLEALLAMRRGAVAVA